MVTPPRLTLSMRTRPVSRGKEGDALPGGYVGAGCVRGKRVVSRGRAVSRLFGTGAGVAPGTTRPPIGTPDVSRAGGSGDT